MAQLGWRCFFLISFSSPLWSLPVSSSEASYWLSDSGEDARLNLEALSGRSRGSLRQTLPELLRAWTDNSPSKAGLGANNLMPRENVKEVAFGNAPRNAWLSRLLAMDRKPDKKRRNLSECFWKYCV